MWSFFSSVNPENTVVVTKPVVKKDRIVETTIYYGSLVNIYVCGKPPKVGIIESVRYESGNVVNRFLEKEDLSKLGLVRTAVIEIDRGTKIKIKDGETLFVY